MYFFLTNLKLVIVINSTVSTNWIINEYTTLLIYFLISLLLSFILLFLSLLYNYEQIDLENFLLKTKNIFKLTAYECGFEAFNDARSRFNIHYYLVGMLFIIFDLELLFLFPWAMHLSNIGILGFWSMFIFLFILTLGFIYEWKKGALLW